MSKRRRGRGKGRGRGKEKGEWEGGEGFSMTAACLVLPVFEQEVSRQKHAAGCHCRHSRHREEKNE